MAMTLGARSPAAERADAERVDRTRTVTRYHADQEFLGPFPALTPAERFHYDVHGFVVLRNKLQREQRDLLAGRLLDIRGRIAAGEEVGDLEITRNVSGCTSFGRFEHYDDALRDYLLDPYLVAANSEVCGGTVRLSSSNAIVNTFNPEARRSEKGLEYDFHARVRPGPATWTRNGLFHVAVSRSLTYLTDVGPDDGGTVFVSGSHKIDVPIDDVVRCARENPGLVSKVVAEAGTTVLFSETTVHAAGLNESGRERIVISGTYTPTMYQAWNGQAAPPGVLDDAPDGLRAMFGGDNAWEWRQRYRRLDTEAQTAAEPPEGDFLYDIYRGYKPKRRPS